MSIPTAFQEAQQGVPPMDFLDARLELSLFRLSHRRAADRERER
jgi:hypothetical protein